MSNKFLKWLIPTIFIGLISSCSNSGTVSSNGDSRGPYNLVVDNTSPVPLVSGSTQQFYVYVKNTGNGSATNLNWNVSDISSSTNKNTTSSWWSSVKNTLSNSKQLQVNGNGIEIVDASNCTNISAGVSCRILLKADSVTNVTLQSTSGNTSAITTNLLSSYTYTPSYSGPADTLTLSPLTSVNYGNGFAGYTFFIMNNSNNTISLAENVFGSLPSGIDYMTLAGASCANPMPAHTACQVRLTMTSSGSPNTIPVSLTPRGSVVGGDTLPTQATTILTVSDEKIGNVDATIPAMSIDANNPQTVTKTAYISNTGSAPLIIGNLNTTNAVVSITSDACSGKTLSPGEICSYQLSIDSSKVNSSGTAVITIPFNNSKSYGSTSSTLNWSYIAAVTLNPAITLSNGGNLTQQTLTSSIVIQNSGNVMLRDLGVPTVTTSSSHVALTNGNCSNELAVGSSCFYTLTYTPVAPSENATVTISGVTAKYIDTKGNTQSITLPAATAVNVTSIFQGVIGTGGDFSLTGTTPSHTVTLTNSGTYDATISTATISGTNLSLSNNNCNGKMLSSGQTCTVTVSLTNSTSVASGNGSLNITYNNHNGNTATTASSNISWLVGEAASLNVNFAQSNLVTNVGSPITDEVTITNDGNTSLNNIHLPIIAAPFSWTVGSNNSCRLDGTQSLGLNESCKLSLVYAPTVSNTAGTVVTLGKFTATTGQGSAYATGDYSITATAIRQNSLTFTSGGSTITSLTQSADWTAQSPISTVTITNTNGSPITINSTPISGISATINGCSSSLNSGDSCTLTITGNNYTSSGSGTLTVNYTDSEGAMSQTLPITVNYQTQPVITPDLTITKNPAGQITLLNDGSVTQITLNLTNATTVQNAINSSSDGTLKIKASSLIPSNVTNATITPNGGSCPAVDGSGYFTLSNQNGSNSCTYILDVTTTAAHNTQISVTADSLYQKQSYSSPTSVGYGADQTGPQIAYNAIVQSATALLSSPTLVDSGQINAFTGIEQGISSPTVSFSVQNVGAAAINGAITAPTIAGFTFDMSNCTNLATNSSCTFTAVLNSATATSGNLSSYSLSYNSSQTAVLPNMAYSVVAPNSPVITSSVSVANCQIGSGIDSDTCLINTGNPAPAVTITFTNSGGVSNNFTLNTTTLATTLGSSAYSTTFGGNCGSGITLNSGDSCTLTINPISPTTTTSDALYDINSTVPYSYQYGSSGQIAGSGNATVIVDSLVATPTLIISDTIAAIDATGNAIADVTLGNWYNSANKPTKPTFGGSIVTAAGVTVSGCDSWTDGAWYSMSCQATITTSATPAGTYDITAQVNAGVSGTITSVPATVIVKPATPKLYIFVTSTKYKGNLQTVGSGATGFDGANNICNTRAAAGSATSSLNANWKALLYNNNATVESKTYYNTSGEKIATATGGNLVGRSDISSYIKYDESGTAIAYPNLAWTDGNNADNCSNWTVNTGGTSYGGYGSTNAIDSTWFYKARQNCSSDARLYCVQQPAVVP